MKMDKLKLAFYWAASCGGCEIAVLDIDEKILDVVGIADILFWPVALDFKYKDVEAMPDQHIDVCFFNGAIRNEENEHIAKLLRKKSKVMVAFGSCAHQGSVIGLGNLWNKDTIFERVYLETQSTENPQKIVPQTSVKIKEGNLTLPAFNESVKTLDQTIDVDYYLHGCPPNPNVILTAVNAIAGGNLPPKGTVLGPQKSVCDECSKVKKDRKITQINRIYEIEIEADDETCLWELGVPCMGPATRAGCGAQCTDVNMVCTGCQGPGPNVKEQGSAMISALSSVVVDGTVMDQLVDPIGTFYKYSLAASILRRRRMK
jgi:F420-non-reducing hydrogenase small subunit